ncbi:glycosyltransferase family 2 protein [Devosia neptuniae]|uniref:Glycosyltransferase family 2 protein n=1 Tax=Devosia neptuniae TaxID=191302 RepID=A0ABY6C9X5_9HYPH|nr:glycosyltransferase family A protein [Devosia neptuniae]UXN69031.1 glycosyltransferase family 2 protein [Devosia neptuniae]
MVATFSVVVPLYNKGPHIERALSSVLGQTLAPVEIIVVDDGSSDGGYEWVKAQSNGLIRHEQRGAPGPGGYAARNRAIDMAHGDWIAFLDADDEWRVDHLAALAAALGKAKEPDRVVTLFSGYEDIYPGDRHEIDPFTRHFAGRAVEMDFRALLQHWVALNASPIWTSATACRRVALLEAGLFPEGRCRRGGDKDTWLRVAHLGQAVYTGAITANYYRDAVNMTTKKGYANTVPCIVQTVDQIMAGEPPRIAGLLRQLKNREIFNYAMVSARTEGLKPHSWADFDGDTDPFRFFMLRALSNRVGSAVARGVHKSRALLRGR